MRFLTIALFFFIPSSLFAQHASSMMNTVVKVIVHKQEMDSHEPWKNGRIYTEEHVGTIVPFNNGNEKGILIKASALAFQKRIEMQVLSGTDLIQLIPRFIDNEVNLALLETSESEILDSLNSILISDQEIPLEEDVYLYKIDMGNHIDRLRCSLRNVHLGERVDTSSYPIINYVFKAPRKELGWSEPILSKGRLVALAVGEDDDYNVHAIPGPMILHFLNDDLGKDYQGFPTIGIEYTNLSSPHTREALNIEKNSKQGVLVHHVSKQSSFYNRIKKGDVLLSIDGKAINTYGNFVHRLWGELPPSALFYKRYAGEKITVEILRNKKKEKITGELKRYDSNSHIIPYYQTNEKLAYLIVGGLVFQELTRPFIRAWGKNWLGDAPSSLLYQWLYKNGVPNKPDERIIILNQVLADRMNKGYENIGNAIVKRINTLEIHSMNDLENALRKPVFKNNEFFEEIQLDYGEGEVILSVRELIGANSRIADNYGIYDKNAFFIPR